MVGVALIQLDRVGTGSGTYVREFESDRRSC